MKKNILIIDDSALMRRVISDIINSDLRYHVAGFAVNGLEGLDELTQNAYDVAILDINMPKMNGLELMEEIQKRKISTKVIIVSTIAKEGAIETIRALELGAFDFVTKPESFYETKSESFRNKLLKAVTYALLSLSVEKANNDSHTIRGTKFHKVIIPNQEKKSFDSIKPFKTSHNKKKLIAIACSTGGPKALQSVIPYLPKNIDAPVLIVQHMPAGFTRSLAERLNEISELNVKEAEDGDVLEPGVVYIAKGGNHMRLHNSGLNSIISLDSDAPKSGLRPCADYMYESLVRSNYHEIVCIVMTGMGSDGTKGIKKLKENNNIHVIAQDKETSVVYGMPKAVFVEGLVDEVVPLGAIADAVTRYVGVR